MRPGGEGLRAVPHGCSDPSRSGAAGPLSDVQGQAPPVFHLTPRPPLRSAEAGSAGVPPHPPAPSPTCKGRLRPCSTSPPGPLSENRRGGDLGCTHFFDDEPRSPRSQILGMPRDAHPGAKALATEFRKEPTGPERAAWELLRGRRCLGLKFRRQEAVASFVLDFYCPALLLGVEIDGPTHRYDGSAERDAERDSAIRAQGIEVVRIHADQVTMPVLEEAIRPFLDRRRWT